MIIAIVFNAFFRNSDMQSKHFVTMRRNQGTKNGSDSWYSSRSLDGKNDNSLFCFTFCDLLTIHTLFMPLGSLRILSNNGSRPLLARLFPLLWDLAYQCMTCPEIKFCNKINFLSSLHPPVWAPCHTTHTITSYNMFYINKLYPLLCDTWLWYSLKTFRAFC